jgi:UDP-3-O-[3-hydroxymyristoyl] N-acetylglucosamine deacetylase
MMNEKTIQYEVSCSGIGLHSGEKIQMKLSPSAEGTGILFCRTDLGGVLIPANISHVVSTHLSTTIGLEGATVQTIEHLLAAISAFGIDNLIIELDGPEVPILDGSAAPFAELLSEAGIVDQKKAKRVAQVVEPVTVLDKGRHVTLSPASTLEISYQIQFDHPLISSQTYRYQHGPETFMTEIAPARTFGFLKDVQMLQSMGLARGGSLENAIVIGEAQVLNEGGLRFSDEFVRHKILDLIGDLSLLGMPILGRIEAVCSGHMLHARLIKELLQNKKACKISGAVPTAEPYWVPSPRQTPIYSPLSSAI